MGYKCPATQPFALSTENLKEICFGIRRILARIVARRISYAFNTVIINSPTQSYQSLHLFVSEQGEKVWDTILKFLKTLLLKEEDHKKTC